MLFKVLEVLKIKLKKQSCICIFKGCRRSSWVQLKMKSHQWYAHLFKFFNLFFERLFPHVTFVHFIAKIFPWKQELYILQADIYELEHVTEICFSRIFAWFSFRSHYLLSWSYAPFNQYHQTVGLNFTIKLNLPFLLINQSWHCTLGKF